MIMFRKVGQRFGACLRAAVAMVCVALAVAPAHALDHTQLAVIINTADPLSVQIGDYYAAQRRISFQNLIRVELPPGKTDLTREEFAAFKTEVDARTLPRVQAYALTWAAPYRVECMSITSALAFGFDPASCSGVCKPTPLSRYFNSNSALPYTQLKIRPTMAIAATKLFNAAVAAGWTDNGNVRVMDLWGNRSGTLGNYTFSGDHQDQLYLIPVPEPETYAMMLAGLGLMGFVARRRSKRVE